jgi:acyl transferase domain-containing protein/acyl carrier protein/SAM-dependent methyltransferase
MITSPNFYQNLAAASFLSPTGASKAFSDDADGYCRGEGAGMLVLKPLHRAIADGDRIVGTIAGSAVNQNSSSTPITVPDSNSQSDLYLEALSRGGISPSEVTYVEAHGTGTPVGDPIECASIRTAFGGPERSQEVVIGSVKDVIGHTESASGVAGIIKTLLMMQHGSIPKQPNFNRLNPKIPSLGPDKMAIADRTRPWNDLRRRTALVNNYGAAGSNAAIVLQEYVTPVNVASASLDKGALEYPVFLSAKTPENLQAYAMALKSFIDRHDSVTLADIAYNLARKQNRLLEFSASWTTTNLDALRRELNDLAAGTRTISQRSGEKKKAAVASPVVLCFGGQTGRNIYLSRDVYNGSALLRAHLDRCDDVCRTQGLPSLFPRIFDSAPVDDLVVLHAMLFSVQYATAKAWMNSGIKVAAVIGHSFGQLTALCVAGSMSFVDGLRLVTGRARLIEKLWGAEPGVMLAVEGDADALNRLITQTSHNQPTEIDIACYNGPRNVVFAGEAAAIDTLERACKASQGLKVVKLANSHAYHSRLTEPILKAYKTVAQSIDYQPQSIHVETCSPGKSWSNIDATKIVEHTRETVHFGEAVQRIASKHASAIWLEAGSASPIIGMVRRALPSTRGSTDVLLSTDLGKGNPWTSLSKASTGLWAAGLTADFWAFHGAQANRYQQLDLPPYQFTKTKHWLQYRPYGPQQKIVQTSQKDYGRSELLRRISDGANESVFVIDPSHEVFELSVRGHAVVDQSLCPAGLYFELAIRAAKAVHGSDVTDKSLVPHIEDLQIASPLGLKPDSTFCVALTPKASHNNQIKFDFSFFTGSDATKRTVHASGSVALLQPQALTSRFQSLGRLIGSKRYNQVVSSPGAERLSGSVLYKVFARVVSYAPYYKGVKNAVASGGEVVGDVAMPKSEEADRLAGISDPLAIDNFLQLAGIHANCLQAESSDNDVSVCNAIGEVLWSEAFLSSRDTRSWKVYSNMEFEGKSTATNDVFVLDTATGAIVLALLEVKFHQVSLASLRRVLSKLNKDTNTAATSRPLEIAAADDVFRTVEKSQPTQDLSTGSQAPVSSKPPTNATLAPATSTVALELRKMLSDIFGMSVEEVKPESDLADLGVDSLMITEISGEIQTRFNVTLSIDDLQELTDVQSLVLKVDPSAANTTSSVAPPEVTTNGSGEPDLQTQTNGTAHTNVLTNGHVETEEDNGVASIANDWYASNGNTFDTVVQESGFGNFRKDVYPLQAELVVAYVIEALASLGCDLRQLRAGQSLPTPTYLPKHRKLMNQMYRILEDAGLVVNMVSGPNATRTSTPVPTASAQDLHNIIVPKFPQYTGEHQLLQTTGARLADCLTGKVEPLSLMFGTAESRRLMGEVYTNGPMFKAATSYLSGFLMDVASRFQGKREIRILELGAGTGGTTNFLVQQLEKMGLGHKVKYTFSDISGSLVAAARKRFGVYSFVDYALINVEKDPMAQYQGKYDVIISTNCIHATPSLVRSCTNIKHMLREDGMLCLVEHTQNLYWFDLVWGLVDGWWLFDDGRKHALASESRWKQDLYASGFSWVNWSNGPSQESQILRVIVASPTGQTSRPTPTAVGFPEKPDSSLATQETVTFKHVGTLPLNADIYYPSTAQTGGRPRPVGETHQYPSVYTVTDLVL